MANIKIIELKAQRVAEVAEKIKSAQSVVIFDYRGLTVEEDTNLRNEMRKAGVEYLVIKNSIVERAAQAAGRAVRNEESYGREPQLSRIIVSIFRRVR